MRRNKLILSVVFLLGVGLTGIRAQEVILSSGGEASGSGGSASYSVGQIADTAIIGTSYSIVEGVQQPYEISIYTAIGETEGINLMLAVYPNPTTDYLTLSIDEFDLSNLSYQLFDINGQLVEENEINENYTDIDMSNCLPSVYFLKILQKNIPIKTFKIIKN